MRPRTTLPLPLPFPCGAVVLWWEGEYEGECEGDHFDGLSWFNEDREPTDDAHG